MKLKTGLVLAFSGAILALTVALGSDQQLAVSDYEPIDVAVEAARWEALARSYMTDGQKAIVSALLEEAVQSTELEIQDVNDYINYHFGGEGTITGDEIEYFVGGGFSKPMPN